MFAVAFPLVAWLLCFCLCREGSDRFRISKDWRFFSILASVAWGAILTLLVEVLSLFRGLTAPALAISWAIVDFTLFLALTKLYKQRQKSIGSNWGDLRSFVSGARQNWPLEAKLFLAVTAVIAAVLFWIALVTPSSNYDSMTYHLPRVMHWIQQRSIDHFPTGNTRQIEFAPWSSFAILNLCLLCGNDRLANLVQWLSMIGTLIAGQYIALKMLEWYRQRNGETPDAGEEPQKKRLAALTALLIVTLPIGVVESITTQNDYVATFWLCSLLCCGLALLEQPENWFYWLAAGLSAGLGTLSKPLTYIYAAPFIIVVGFLLLRRLQNSRNRFNAILCFSAVFLMLNISHMIRNYTVFGSPFGSAHIVTLERNQRTGVTVLLSNLLRNLSLHGNTGTPVLTQSVGTTISTLHGMIGENDNDPATTYHIGKFMLPEVFFVFDSYASCTWHLLLIIAMFTIALFNRKLRFLLPYFCMVLGSIILFCALLKWQIWHSRLHLAYFAITIPAASLVMVKVIPSWGRILCAVGLTVFAGCSLVNNASRPILDKKYWSLPREEQYLTMGAASQTGAIKEVADAIVASHCSEVGLKLGFDDVEYPFWVMLRNRGFHGHITHYAVENESNRIVSTNNPCVIISVFQKIPESVTQTYPRQQQIGKYTLLWR